MGILLTTLIKFLLKVFSFFLPKCHLYTKFVLTILTRAYVYPEKKIP